MNKNLFYRLEFAGVFFTVAVGLFLQFAYSIADGAAWTVIFASVNSSLWELNKVFALPYIVWSVITLAVSRPPFKAFFASKIAGAYIIVFAPLLLSSLISGIFGTRFRAVEIIVSIIFVVLGYIFSANMSSRRDMQAWFVTALFALLLFAASYFCFTYSPPEVGIFYDESTCSYGVPVSSYRADEVLDAVYSDILA